MNMYNPLNPKYKSRGEESCRTQYTKRAKKLYVTFAAGNNFNLFFSAYKSYVMSWIDSLVVGHFGEVNK